MEIAEELTIRPAEWPRDLAVAVELLRHYADFLLHNPAGAVEICMQGYEEELASLPARCSAPNGVLLLAFLGDVPAGCVVVKQRADRPGSCEMKRLFTEPVARGRGVGRALIEAAIEWSRGQGATALLLDTVAAAMPDAVRLYRAMGFVETARHNDNRVADLLFLQLELG